MSEAKAPTGTRYRAFISYSHKDASFASRLHRRLEGYVLPKRLGVGRRLTPIFKDREELPAAHDLSAQVRAALAASDCLIVVCSPDAAASQWVGREIETFRALHPHRPILAALVRGEPAGAFPEALAAGGIEPLAADFRKAGDGDRLALLKLLAGMAKVGIDQLVQRDTQRRLKAATALAVGLLVGMLAMAGATLSALWARTEADQERARAERLAEFMLTDLRFKLNEVGRLDVMEGVNRRIWREYGNRDLERLKSLPPGLQAVLLLVSGEDAINRGDLPSARSHFSAAREITTEQLRKKPRDPSRVFALSQSEYWLGYVSFLEGNAIQARSSWKTYKALSLRLSLSDPTNKTYRMESGFADGNLCTLSVSLEHDARKAVTSCRNALDQMASLLSEEPLNADQQTHVANRHGWMADAWRLEGNLGEALRHRAIEQRMLEALLAQDPKNMTHRIRWVANQRAMGTLEGKTEQFNLAMTRLMHASKVLDELIKFEPANVELIKQRERYDFTISKIREDKARRAK